MEVFFKYFVRPPYLGAAANPMLPFTILMAKFWKFLFNTLLDDQCWGLGVGRVAGDGDMWF